MKTDGAAWLALTAPGLLVSRGIVVVALVCAPFLTAFVYSEAVVRGIAAALLLAHAAATALAVRRPGRGSSAVAYALLAIDAGLCGVLLGARWSLVGPGLPLAVLVLAMGLEAGGPGAALGCALVMMVGGFGAAWLGISRPLVFAPAVVFPISLSVETAYDGVPVLATRAPAFPTVLSVEPSLGGARAAAESEYAVPTALTVETSFAGVSAVGSGAPLVVPGLVLVLGAICVGAALSLWRVRHAAMTVAYPRGGPQ